MLDRRSAPTSKRRRLGSWYRARLGVFAFSIMGTTSVGAATRIETVVNSDPVMCARLLQMVKAADFPAMTDKQLCEFRFSQLPPSVTKGFTFLRRHKLQVADAPTMYVKMLHANRAPGSVANKPNYVKERWLAEQAARKGVIAFYTAQLPISAVTLNASYTPPRAGSDYWTIIFMEQTKCPSAVPGIAGRPWLYSIFEKPDLQMPVPSMVSVGAELALWHGKLFVLDYPPYWQKFGPGPSGIYVSLDIFWWTSGGDRVPAGMWGGTHCSFNINKLERN